MDTLSPVVVFAWDIAASEASHARSANIEPEHLFIGLCKLEDFATVASLREIGYKLAQAEQMEPEIARVLKVFYRLGLSPSALRRALRKHKGTGFLQRISGLTTGSLRTQRAPDERMLHRSAASRQVFVRAAELAQADRSSVIMASHLLVALIDHPQSQVGPWLRKHDVDVDLFLKVAQETLA